jgi:hypothetical protein
MPLRDTGWRATLRLDHRDAGAQFIAMAANSVKTSSKFETVLNNAERHDTAQPLTSASRLA